MIHIFLKNILWNEPLCLCEGADVLVLPSFRYVFYWVTVNYNHIHLSHKRDTCIQKLSPGDKTPVPEKKEKKEKTSGYSQGKSTIKQQTSAYKKYKYGHLGRWYIKSILCKMLLILNKIFKKKKVLVKLHFVLTILFVLTLASNIAVL